MTAFNQQTWDKWEDATNAGHVTYLYKITVSGRRRSTVRAYCTGSDKLVYNGVEYKPYPCKHNEIKNTVDDSTTSINFAASKSWISVLLENTPHKVSVEVVRYKTDIDMGSTLYSGEMRKSVLDVNTFTLDFGSSFAAANTDLILYYTQRFCNHAQYQYLCGMNFDAYAVTIPPGMWSLSGRKQILLHSSYNLDPTYWQELVMLYESRFVEEGEEYIFELDNLAVSARGRSISTKFPVSCGTDPKVDALTIAPNCMLQLQRCRDVFGNLPRSCAWPDMPLQNFAAIDVEQQGKGTGGPLGPPSER